MAIVQKMGIHMSSKTETQQKQNVRFFLSVILSIALAFCMVPAASTAASADSGPRTSAFPTGDKTYIYNYMYGTYNQEYALGFHTYYGIIEEVDIVSATKGVTLSVENYDYTTPYWLETWINGLVQASVPDVIGMPVRTGKTVKYVPYRLSGKKLSSTKYDKVVYFSSKQISGGKGTALFKASKTRCVIDVYNNYGKKVQSIKAKTENGQMGNIEFQNGKIYLNVQDTWYVLRNGKFVKSKKPTANYSYSDNYPLLQSEMVSDDNGANGTFQWYLLDKNGARTNLPFNGGASYVKVNDLGVYCIDSNRVCYLYNNQGKLLATIKNANSIDISESAVPKVFVLYKNGKPNGAYNSSFKLITKKKSLVERYANCWYAGVYKNQKIYAVRSSSKQMSKNSICQYLKKNMKPLKIRSYSLVGKIANTQSAPKNLSSQKAFVGMNAHGRLFLINSKGKKIVPFSFTNFDVRENAKYALVAIGKEWRFVPLPAS